jgi:hypothetical protein
MKEDRLLTRSLCGRGWWKDLSRSSTQQLDAVCARGLALLSGIRKYHLVSNGEGVQQRGQHRHRWGPPLVLSISVSLLQGAPDPTRGFMNRQPCSDLVPAGTCAAADLSTAPCRPALDHTGRARNIQGSALGRNAGQAPRLGPDAPLRTRLTTQVWLPSAFRPVSPFLTPVLLFSKFCAWSSRAVQQSTCVGKSCFRPRAVG